MKRFPCEGCGRCCRSIGCMMLDGDRCSIYEERPEICRVNETWERKYKGEMSLEEYHIISKGACLILRRMEDGR